MEVVYQKIVDTITGHPEVFTNRGVSIPRTIDMYVGQPEDPENFELFFPAIFINWEIMPSTSDDPDTLYIEAHVLQEPDGHTEGGAPDISAGLNYLRLLKAVKCCLNKLSTEVSSPLGFNGEKPSVTPYFSYHILKYKGYIDSDDDSVFRPNYSDTTVEAIKVKGGVLRQKQPDVIPDIDTYK